MTRTHSNRVDWLVDAGRIAVGETLVVHPCGDLNWMVAQSALDAQYGKGTFETSQHGTTLRARRLKVSVA